MLRPWGKQSIWLIVLLLVFGWLYVYVWRYQVLPQSALANLPVIQPPRSSARLVVFSPHPDDETLGAGGFISEARTNGAEIWVVLVTNGQHFGGTQVRYQEFQKATTALGVPSDHLIYLGRPDGGLRTVNKEVLMASFQKIIDEIHPNAVVAPLPTDLHPDHAITGQLVRAIVSHQSSISLYEYLVHHRHFPIPKGYHPNLSVLPPTDQVSPQRSWQTFDLSGQAETVKETALKAYQSQLRVPVLKNLLVGLVRKNELFVVEDFSAGHPGGQP